MNKSEFVARVAKKSGQPQTLVAKIVDAALATTEEALKQGDSISIVGFGSLEVKHRAPRKGRNPKTKEEIIIPASKQPVFKPGRTLKEAVNS